MPEFFGKPAQLRRQNARSRKQETSLAADIGGRVQSGSGSSWRARGDVKSEDYLVECKYTDGKSYSLRADIWQQIERDAEKAGRDPMMIIEFAVEGITLQVVRVQ